jgi:pyrroloquinoline quinone (PQQ) biosynthesis protein C
MTLPNAGFRRPVLRSAAEWRRTGEGAEFRYLDGQRFVQFEFEQGRREDFYRFLGLLGDSSRPMFELTVAFPGTVQEWEAMLAALDEQGMLAEGDSSVCCGSTGTGAYARLRRVADQVRQTVRSPLFEALEDGSITHAQLMGYAVEYWHVTHLCPRVIAPVLARDDHAERTWQKLMSFYLIERNHDRMLENSLKAVGVSREQLLRAQPLPATMALMAAMGVYAYDFPLALIATLFTMEEQEPEFLQRFVARCTERGLPAAFIRPIIDHSEVNEAEEHEAVTLDLLADFPFLGEEEVQECGKAVADIIEQRARLDAEILQWYGSGGLRDFSGSGYPRESGEAITCAPLTSLA